MVILALIMHLKIVYLKILISLELGWFFIIAIVIESFIVITVVALFKPLLGLYSIMLNFMVPFIMFAWY